MKQKFEELNDEQLEQIDGGKNSWMNTMRQVSDIIEEVLATRYA